MIVLFTDFGLDGLYVGQMHALINSALPDTRVIDLCHTLPAQDICAASYLLPAYTRYLPPTSIIICVVDPDVGSERPHAVCKADEHWYIGPDNGLFDVLQQHAHSFSKYHFRWPGQVSNSFHARDVYAPAACLLSESNDPAVLKIHAALDSAPVFPAELNEIIFFDHYGNAITGLRSSSVSTDSIIVIKDHKLDNARVFSDVSAGQGFWYENANGLLEIAVNQGSAKDTLGLQRGDSFHIA
jgi:S-adenosylmethionine hydrolase